MRIATFSSFRRVSALALLAASVTACGSKDAAPDDAKIEAPAERTLYERLGGQEAIVAVVDDFVGNVAADTLINGFFANTDIPRLKTLLVQQICAATGGSCTYTGRDMKTTHAGMGVTADRFAALVADLVKTLNKFNVPQKEQDELLALLGPMQGDIVTR